VGGGHLLKVPHFPMRPFWAREDWGEPMNSTITIPRAARTPFALSGALALSAATCMAQTRCPEWLSTGATTGLAIGPDRIGSLASIDHDQSGPQPTTYYGYRVYYTGGNVGHFPNNDHFAFTMEGGARPSFPLLPAQLSAYGMLPLNESVAGFSAGTLIVYGNYESADRTVLGIGAWDGTTFRSVGPAVAVTAEPNVTYGMIACDPDDTGPLPRCIVAYGNFTSFRGVPAPGVAAWDGVVWRGVDLGLPARISWMGMLDPDGPGGLPPALHAHVPPTGGTTYGTYALRNGVWTHAFDEFVGTPFMLDPDDDGPMPPQWRTATFVWNGTRWVIANDPWPSDFPGGPQAVQVIDLDGDGPGGARLVSYGLWRGTDALRYRMFAVLGPQGWYFPPGYLNEARTSVPGYMSFGLRAGFVADPDGAGPRGREFVMITSGPGSGGAPNYANGAGNFVTWDGSILRPLRSGLLYNSLYNQSASMWGFKHHDPDGPGPAPRSLYISGWLADAFNSPANGLAVFQNGQWRGQGAISSADPIFVTRWLVEHDHDGDPSTPVWFVGIALQGAFATTPLARRFTGTSWQTIGNLTLNTAQAELSGVTSACSFDDDGPGPNPSTLYISGLMTPSCIMKLQGDQWVSAGTPITSAPIFFLNTFDPDGTGPQPLTLLAQRDNQDFLRWNGTAWEPYIDLTLVQNTSAEGTNYRWNPVVLDTDGPGPRGEELIVGASRIVPGQSQAFYGAAAFDGSTWRQLGNASLATPQQAFRGAFVVDVDGPGPGHKELILCGTTSVQWLRNGSWYTIPLATRGVVGYEEGVEGPAPNELWFAGEFTQAGGMPATGFARWRLADAAGIVSQPINQGATRTGETAFTVVVSGTEPRYQWRRNGVPVANGPAGASRNGGVVTGAQSMRLSISRVACSDAGDYDCVVSNACGSLTSRRATLDVLSICCPWDLDNDGDATNGGSPDDSVDINDWLYFLASFEAGSLGADLDDGTFTGSPDDAVTISDLVYFLTGIEAGC
jgi:Immunoglobulin I-set domain